MEFWKRAAEAFKAVKDRVAGGGQSARDSWGMFAGLLADLLEKANPFDTLEEKSRGVIDYAEERFADSSRKLIDEKWPQMVGEVDQMLSRQTESAEARAQALIDKAAVRFDALLSQHRASAEQQAIRLMYRLAGLILGVGVVLIGLAYVLFRLV